MMTSKEIQLKQRIEQLESELKRLKVELAEEKQKCSTNSSTKQPTTDGGWERSLLTKEATQKGPANSPIATTEFIPTEKSSLLEQVELTHNNSVNVCPFTKCALENNEIERYSRQMILPEIGVKGQLCLRDSSVLVVGTGGLGCPSALYLASAGVGTIGLTDFDSVDLSNLHRQILHTEDKIGMDKVLSAIQDLKRINSNVNFIQHSFTLTSKNALEVIQKYDVVLDCTDNVATRYLLNDTCVLANKPLVSGSALRFEGQLIVYNYNDGPCYRCLYPTPPPPETVTNCSDGGVIGAVTGVIGSLQALEAIKIITSQKSSYNERMLLYDGLEGTFRSIKLRNKKASCSVCGVNPTVTSLQDYEQFCGAKASDKERTLVLLERSKRITVEEYKKILLAKTEHLLVDVRPSVEYQICSLQASTNIPLSDLEKGRNMESVNNALQKKSPVFFICKRGNDSQTAVRYVLKQLELDNSTIVQDVIGGLHAWINCVDPSFPKY